MNLAHDYKNNDVVSILKKIGDLIDPISAMSKDGVTPGELAKKKGTKIELATTLIEMANCLTKAKILIEKIHGRNFDLMGKIVSENKLSDSLAQSQVQTDIAIKKIQSMMKDKSVCEESNLCSVSYADVASKNCDSLVSPMKKAMKQVKEDEHRKFNVIVRGIDIDPREPTELNCKEQAKDALDEIAPAGMYTPDLEKIKVLGKIVGKEGKAPPILVPMGSIEDVKIILAECAKNLKKFPQLKNVYLTPDFSNEQRENRKILSEKLRAKIKEDPSQHWVIRSGTVLAVGEHITKAKTVKMNKSSVDELDKSYMF